MTHALLERTPYDRTERHAKSFAMLGMVAAAAYAVDNSKLWFDRHNRSASEAASIETYSSNGDNGDGSLFVLPGCRTDGHVVAAMMDAQLASFSERHYLSHPTIGYSLESEKGCLLEKRGEDNKGSVSMLALSKGGLVAVRALADPDFQKAFGHIDRLVLDSCPAGAKDIRLSSRRAMRSAAILKRSWTATKLSGEVMYRKDLHHLAHDNAVTDEQVRQHYRSTSRTPLHLAHAQAGFIGQDFTIEAGQLADCVSDIYYVQSPYDSVIDTDQAFESYNAMFDGKVTRVIDESRPAGSHAASPEFQAACIDLLGVPQQRAAYA